MLTGNYVLNTGYKEFERYSMRNFYGFVMDARLNAVKRPPVTKLIPESLFLRGGHLFKGQTLCAITNLMPDLGGEEKGFLWEGLDNIMLLEAYSVEAGYYYYFRFVRDCALVPVEDADRRLALQEWYKQAMMENHGRHVLSVQLDHSPNPDIAGDGYWDAPQDDPDILVNVANITEASAVCRQYIKRNHLGGGNWTGGGVFDGSTQIARVSYNGRIWAMDGSEIQAV